jgi:hypothetical protein
MHRYLGSHPEIFMSATKELNFFVTAGWWRAPHERSAAWSRGLSWYEEQFQDGTRHRVRGESSPCYTMEDGSRLAAERIAAVLPEARFIYLVRDPIARIRSHYMQDLSVRLVSPRVTLDQILDAGPDGPPRLSAMWSGYVHTSMYARQLSVYLDYFGLDQFAVVPLRRLRDETARTMRELFEFVGVSSDFSPPNLEERYNRQNQRLMRSRLARDAYWNPTLRSWLSRLPNGLKRVGKRVVMRSRPYDADRLAWISPQNIHRLTEMFASDRQELERLTGLDLSHWTV